MATPTGLTPEATHPPTPAALPSLLVGSGLILAVSLVITAIMAWPVLRSPATVIFGHEIVGRHHDPFTVIQQFASGGAVGLYRQPLTDDVGAAVASMLGPVQAYNLLVLASFPLTALFTYWLGRYLLGSHRGALVAALAFAFAPIHVAQASYHLHVAQAQWIPLYLLALFAAIDQPTLFRLLLLLAAVAGLVLSNDYGGLIGAFITPVALPAYWLAQWPRRWAGLWRPASALILVLVAALIVISRLAPVLLTHPAQFAFPPEDVARYGARWWAYVVPPIDHPLFGVMAQSAASRANIDVGLLEQQLSLGWSLMVLALIGAAAAVWPAAPRQVPRSMVAIAAIGAWAFVASLAPSSPHCLPGSLVPACAAYAILPMFRAYARLGFVTSLAVAVLAGAAVALLTSRPSAESRVRARWLLSAVLVMAVIEWWPLPGRARDVLPTEAHRWLAGQTRPLRVLDCTPWTPADASLAVLMQKDLQLLQRPMLEACDDPGLAEKLAALGFTHVLTRRSQPAPWRVGAVPPGLTLIRSFPTGRVYEVSATAPPLVVVGMLGFYPWERNDHDRWRWMGATGDLLIMNTTPVRRALSLRVALESFVFPRHLAVSLDGAPLPGLDVWGPVRDYAIASEAVAPGTHTLRFRAIEPATRPTDTMNSTDSRELTIAVHHWSSSASVVQVPGPIDTAGLKAP